MKRTNAYLATLMHSASRGSGSGSGTSPDGRFV
jgi:hypothetical protein